LTPYFADANIAYSNQPGSGLGKEGGFKMSSVYKVVEIIGTSTKSWEDAAAQAVATASKSLKDLRVAEVIEMDMQIEEGKVIQYRTKLHVSFKYLGKD
jgi:dodecin